MTTPLSLVYQAIAAGAFNTLANIPAINNAPPGQPQRISFNVVAVMSYVLGDENTTAQPDSVIAPIVQAYLQNQQATINNQIASQQATLATAQRTLTAIGTSLTAVSTAISASPSQSAPVTP